MSSAAADQLASERDLFFALVWRLIRREDGEPPAPVPVASSPPRASIWEALRRLRRLADLRKYRIAPRGWPPAPLPFIGPPVRAAGGGSVTPQVVGESLFVRVIGPPPRELSVRTVLGARWPLSLSRVDAHAAGSPFALPELGGGEVETVVLPGVRLDAGVLYRVDYGGPGPASSGPLKLQTGQRVSVPSAGRPGEGTPLLTVEAWSGETAGSMDAYDRVSVDALLVVLGSVRELLDGDPAPEVGPALSDALRELVAIDLEGQANHARLRLPLWCRPWICELVAAANRAAEDQETPGPFGAWAPQWDHPAIPVSRIAKGPGRRTARAPR